MRIPGFGEIGDIPELLRAEQAQQVGAMQAEQQRLIALAAARHAETHAKLDRIIGICATMLGRLDRLTEQMALMTRDG